MKVDTIRTKKGELLLLLEEDEELYLVCKGDGVQVHLEEKQLDLNTRAEIEIKSTMLTEQQRKAWESFEKRMEQTQEEVNSDRKTA